MPDIFLSYSRGDQAIAQRFAEALQLAGLSVWWDQSLQPGEDFDQITEQALEQAKAVVVLWSKTSVSSRWVRAEATQAAAAGKLVPVMIEDCKRPIMFELKHTADLAGWKGDSDDASWLAFVGSLLRFTGTARTAQASIPAVAQGNGNRRRMRATALATALVLGVVSVAFTVFSFWPSAAVTEDRPIRIVMRPMVNQSNDPGLDYIVSSLTADLNSQLRDIKGIEMISIETSSLEAIQGVSPLKISAVLGVDVDHVLDGEVFPRGNILTVYARLTSTRDLSEKNLGQIDLERGDGIGLAREFAEPIARALSITVDVSDLPRSKGGTTDTKARELYERGQAAILRRDYQEGLDFMRQASDRDQAFINANFALWSLLNIHLNLAAPDARDALRMEQDVIATRLEGLPLRQSQRLSLEAGRLWQKRQWADSVNAARAAASAGNGDGERFFLGWLLMSVGNMTDAVGQLEMARDLNPGSNFYSTQLQGAFAMLGRYDEQQLELDRALSAGLQMPSREVASILRRGKASDPQMLKALQSAVESQGGAVPWLPPGKPVPPLDDQEAVRTSLHRAFESAAGTERAMLIALWAQFYGDRELAIEALASVEVSRDAPGGGSLWSLPSLRTEPGFKGIVKALRIDEYWRSTGDYGDFCREVDSTDFECFEEPVKD